MKAKILTFSSQGDTTLLEYDPATADLEEVNKVTVTGSGPGVGTSSWTLNSFALSHTPANRRVFLLRRTRTCRAQKWLRLHCYN